MMMQPPLLFRVASLAVLSALLATTLSTTGPARADDDADPDLAAATEVVVKLIPPARIAQINSDYRTVILETILASRNIYLVGVPPGVDSGALSADMEDDPRIEYAEPNFVNLAPEANPRSAHTGNTPSVIGSAPQAWTDQPAVRQVRLGAAHRRTKGAGQVVAVLDTGVALSHPALSRWIAPGGYDFVDDDRVPADERGGLDSDGDGKLDEIAGHGTHVAGIVRLVAPNARVLPLRVLDSEGRGNVFTVAEAIDEAVDKGARALNLSLGMPPGIESELLEDVTDDLPEDGVVVVASAGNDASTRPPSPAGEDDVIAVGSVSPQDRRSGNSNYGPWITVVAPGEQIVSAFPFPTSGYARWSGTSMAAPFVAGQAALLLSAGAGADRVEALIRGAAKPAGWGVGSGRIDIGASLAAVPR